MFHQVRLTLSASASSWPGLSIPQKGGNFATLAVLVLSLSVGCSNGSEEGAGAELSDEPMVEVILGDSERGSSDGIGAAARGSKVSQPCARSRMTASP